MKYMLVYGAIGGAQTGGSPPRVRRAGGIQAGEFTGFRVPIDDEQIAAHAGHHGLGHGQDRVGGDGRVGR